jgi:predicted component of viral defense system (DUF524 family)
MQKHNFNSGHCTITLEDESVFRLIETTADSLWVVTQEEAIECSEAMVQVREGGTYEYEFSDKYEIKNALRVARQSRISPQMGMFTPGNKVGTLLISYGPIGTEDITGEISVEVRSIKAAYRTDYRLMLGEITDYCTELIMQAGSDINQVFQLDPLAKSNTIYQQFAFIKSLIDNPDTLNAIHRILTAPVTKWKEDFEHKDISRLKRLNAKQLRTLATSNQNDSRRILSVVKRESVDCSENRFIKFALRAFADTCLQVHLKLPESSRESREALRVVETLSGLLSSSIFSDVENITSIPFNSQILQKKPGYREIFKAWLMLDVAGRLSWEGGEDVYRAGKRDVATLYEYWLFFKLLEAVVDIFQLQTPDIRNLIEPTEDGLGLKLKQGKHLVIAGVANLPTRKLNVEFNYNKVFSSEQEYPSAGSWSVVLRPDYTLSIWPSEVSRLQAEKDELITHLHFDSKYRLETSPVVELDNVDLDAEKDETRSYKIADLQKMHTYRDAIRRTAGAYVLYPGTNTKKLKGFHELLPGLGAFAIAPSSSETGIADLKAFLREVVDLLIDRASHREIMSYRTYQTYSSQRTSALNFLLPELYQSTRVGPASETMVLVGYYKNAEHLAWILSSGLYNTRLTEDNVALNLVPALTGAKYLLLYNKDQLITDNLYRIVSQGPKVISGEDLKDLNYPSIPTRLYYLLFEVTPTFELEFNDKQWDVSKLLHSSGDQFGLPFPVSLAELIKTSREL